MKTFGEMRSSALVPTPEQMGMMTGGQDDYTCYCKAVCADGTIHASKKVKSIQSLPLLHRTSCIRLALAGLVAISALLVACKSYITVSGRFGEYAEGGLLRVRTPDTKHLPDPMSSDGWYEQFVVPSIAPDSTGAFSVRVKHRGFGTVYAGEYNRGSWYYLWSGDSVHIDSPRGDSISLHYSNPRSYGLNSLREWYRTVSYDSLKAQVLRILATHDSSRVDSALFARVLLGVRRGHRAQYDSLLRAADIPLRVRKTLYRKEDYFNWGEFHPARRAGQSVSRPWCG